MTTPAVADRPRKLWSLSTIVANVTSNWAGLIVGIAIAFVLAPLTVRTLGNVYYGVWTLLMQLTGYLWLFDFGVRESVIKYVAQYHASGERERINATINTAVSIYLGVSLATLAMAVVLAIALPYAFNIPPDAVTTARLTAVFVGATVAQFFVFNVFIGALMGLQKFYVLARLGMVFTLIKGAMTYSLLMSGYGIVALALVQLSMTLVHNLIILRICRKTLPYLSLRLVWPRREEASTLLNYGKYVLISNVGDKIVFATDSIVIGIFQPVAALTYYAIGGSLIEQFRSFITSMSVVINPLSSGLNARREDHAVATVLTSGARAAIVLGLPVCIGFMVLGERFISLWMGAEYAAPAAQVLAVLAAGHLIGLPYYSLSGVMYGLNRHRVVAYSRIFEGGVNLLLSVWLVQRYGITGVALGTSVPHAIVVAAILPPVLARWVPINLRDYYQSVYLRPLAASLPFWLACWWIEHVLRPANFLMFFTAIGAALIAYVMPCWLVAFSADERALLAGSVMRRVRARRTIEGLT